MLLCGNPMCASTNIFEPAQICLIIRSDYIVVILLSILTVFNVVDPFILVNVRRWYVVSPHDFNL